MAETLPGWSAPVYSGMADTPQYKGVPLRFFAANLLGTLSLAFLCVLIQPVYSVVVVFLGLALHGVVLVATTIEPRLGRILEEYLRYRNLYEG